MSLDLAGKATAVREAWDRAGGLDPIVRVVGSGSVIVTVEIVCGFYLWNATSRLVGLPEALSWAPQFGLVGGAAVGTRAWHRGQPREAKWGRAASIVALLFTVVDAAGAAILLDGITGYDGITRLRSGWQVERGLLALVLIVQCVVVGWLTIHTMLARPKATGNVRGGSRPPRTVPARPERRPEQAPAAPAVVPAAAVPAPAVVPHAVPELPTPPEGAEEQGVGPSKLDRGRTFFREELLAGRREPTAAACNRAAGAVDDQGRSTGLVKGKHLAEWRAELERERRPHLVENG